MNDKKRTAARPACETSKKEMREFIKTHGTDLASGKQGQLIAHREPEVYPKLASVTAERFAEIGKEVLAEASQQPARANAA